MRLGATSICLALVLFALLRPQAAPGRPLVPTIEQLTKAAAVIVLARVEGVERQKDQRVATARVLEVWKGAPAAEVRYRASGAWTCDTSDAVAGETVLLFLAGGQAELMSIAYSGLGRFPVKEADGRRAVALHGNRFPKELKARLGLPPDTFSGLVELGTLKSYVRKVSESPAARQGAPRAAGR